MEELEEEATGEYNRKGEVDRKALLAGSSVAHLADTGKKKKVAFKKGKDKQVEEKEDVFNKLQRMSVKPLGSGEDPSKGPPLGRA